MIGSCTSASLDEQNSLSDVVPDGWGLEVVDLAPANELSRFKIISNKKCSREVVRKPIQESVLEEINPSVQVIFETKWTTEAYTKEETKYQECRREIEAAPMMATACIKRIPTIDTRKYSIFIREDKCSDETTSLYNSLLTHFEKFK